MGQQLSAAIGAQRRVYLESGLCSPCALGAAIHHIGLTTGEGTYPNYREVQRANGVTCKCPTPTFPPARTSWVDEAPSFTPAEPDRRLPREPEDREPGQEG